MEEFYQGCSLRGWGLAQDLDASTPLGRRVRGNFTEASSNPQSMRTRTVHPEQHQLHYLPHFFGTTMRARLHLFMQAGIRRPRAPLLSLATPTHLAFGKEIKGLPVSSRLPVPNSLCSTLNTTTLSFTKSNYLLKWLPHLLLQHGLWTLAFLRTMISTPLSLLQPPPQSWPPGRSPPIAAAAGPFITSPG